MMSNFTCLQITLQLQQASFVARFHQLMHEGGRGGEGDAEPLLAGGKTESQGDMRLAGAGIAERDDVLAAQDELASSELEHQHLVEAGNGGEVEGVEAFDRREACRPDPPLDHSALPVDQLQLHQAQQVAGMIDAVAGAFARDLVVFPQNGRQLQLLEVMRQQNLRGAARRSRRHRLGARLAGHAAVPGTRTA